MKPRRWPYRQNKKQPDTQVARLKNEIAVCKGNITLLEQEVNYLKTR